MFLYTALHPFLEFYKRVLTFHNDYPSSASARKCNRRQNILNIDIIMLYYIDIILDNGFKTKQKQTPTIIL